MGNLSSLTVGDTTFPVGAGGGGSGVIEGEYTIPEVYFSNTSGAKPPSGNTVIGQNAKVWYQKTGKYLRAVIAFVVVNSNSNSSSYPTFGFNESDLFGDGKLFQENSNIVFFKFSGCSISKQQDVQTGSLTKYEPLLWLANSGHLGEVGYSDFYISGTNKLSSFPEVTSGMKNIIFIEAVCL